MASACVTGAGGFIGTHLVRRLRQNGWRVATAQVRAGASARFSPLPGDVVFHLAGLAHRRSGGLASCMAANCDLALDLYDHANSAGASGFVYLSSSKVLGNSSSVVLNENMPRRPVGAYAHSKAAAEEGLLARRDRLGLPLFIVRPPLVYGAGVKANFLALLTALSKGWPLPLAAARSQRSWVSVGNLVDALATLGAALPTLPDATPWHVTDGDDMDVATLCRRIAAKLRPAPRLWPVPRAVFHAAARVGGSYGISTSLVASIFDTFRLDDSALRAALAWSPPQSVDAALDETLRWFHDRDGSSPAASPR